MAMPLKVQAIGTPCTKFGMIIKMPFDNCFAAEIKVDSVMILLRQRFKLQKVKASTVFFKSRFMPKCAQKMLAKLNNK